ncbi:MAG: ScbA/BarX family gamma-butyrolactone biosynthesis protein [Pseudonocardiaceae bacterium]
MTTLLPAPDALGHAGDLSFSRTVDRSLLHRSALSEVFLTDARRVDERRYVAAAQLPPAHPYYTSYSLRPRLLDPLLLLECCRQAETLGAHEYFGVGMGSRFVLREWSMRLSESSAISVPRGPAELIMLVTTRDAREHRRQLRGLRYEIDMYTRGTWLGQVRMSVSYLPPDSYDFLRSRRRGSRPPTTDEYQPVAGGHPAEPYLVGRTNPVDVVLLDPVIGPLSASATLRVPVDNSSMFDHALDHVPGMILMEAARQICLLAGNEYYGSSTTRTAMVAVTASFTAYAELDKPIMVAVDRTPVAEPAGMSVQDAFPGAQWMSVAFWQEEAPVSTATPAMATIVESGRGIPGERA